MKKHLATALIQATYHLHYICWYKIILYERCTLSKVLYYPQNVTVPADIEDKVTPDYSSASEVLPILQPSDTEHEVYNTVIVLIIEPIKNNYFSTMYAKN